MSEEAKNIESVEESDIVSHDDQILRAACQTFFGGWKDFETASKDKNVSKRDVVRAIGHAFHDGLSDIKIKLTSNDERLMSEKMKSVLQGHLIMKSHQMVQQDKKDLEAIQTKHNDDVETKLETINKQEGE